MRFRFADFTLDPELRELRRGDEPIHLERKVFDLIAHLARINGRVASREELLTAVWPGVATTAGSISRAVSLARAALGDRGRGGEGLLQTLRGRGYRLSVPIRIEATSDEGDDFVGRQGELEVLHLAFDRSRSGRGGAVFAAGRAGIGKTRLLRAFEGQARARGARVLWASCFEEAGSPGFWPWMQWIGALAREIGDARLRAMLGSDLECLGVFVPSLGPSRPSVGRAEQFAAITRLLEAVCDELPTVLILDDAHGADDASLQLLRFVASGARATRLLIVAAHRPLERTPGWSRTMDACRRTLGHTEPLDVTGLSRDHIEQLVGRDASEIDVDAVWSRSEGNPFFARQLLRHARRGAGPVPETVRDAVAVQLEPLGSRTRMLLELAAAAGREFGRDLVASAAGLSPAEVTSALRPAVELGILEAGTTGEVLRFEHALVWETCHALPSLERRRQCHERLARVLETGAASGDAMHVETLARHCTAAGLVEESIRYGEQAALGAVAQLAFERAATLYRDVLRSVEAGGVSDARKHCELLVALADAEFRAGDFEASEATSWRAIEASRELGAVELFGRVAERLAYRRQGSYDRVPLERIALFEEALGQLDGADATLRARLTVGLSVDLYWSDLARSERLSREALGLARQADDPDTLLAVLDQRYQHVQCAHQDAERREINAEMLTLAVRRRDLESEFFVRKHRFHEFVRSANGAGADAELGAMAGLAERLRQPNFDEELRIARVARALWRGEQEQAEAMIRPHEVSEGGGSEIAYFAFVTQLFLLRRMQGRLAELEPLVRGGLERFPLVPAFRGGLALILCELDRLDEARIAFQRDAPCSTERFPPTKDHPLNLAVLAEVCARVGDPADAHDAYERLAPHAGQHLVVDAIASFGAADRLLGLLASSLGRDADARRHLEDAIEIERGFGASPFEEWALRDLDARQTRR